MKIKSVPFLPISAVIAASLISANAQETVETVETVVPVVPVTPAPVVPAPVAPAPVTPVPVPVAPAPGAAAVVEKSVTESVDPVTGRTTVTEEVTEKFPTPAPAPFDPVVVQERLMIAPRVIPVDPAAPKVETTETTTVTKAGRVYNVKSNTVIVEGRELAYVNLPVLFEKETATLLDSESRATLEGTAAAVKAVLKANPTAVFEIEGHTSTDGADDFNLKLSADRAKRILDELTIRYAIPATALTANGYGESYPNYPSGTEQEMMLDRRVLVVRTK